MDGSVGSATQELPEKLVAMISQASDGSVIDRRLLLFCALAPIG
jgi:hypothetical protein